MSKEVIISVSNDIVTDQRVLKVVRELSATGSGITVIGRQLPWSLDVETAGFRVIRYRMLFRRGFLFYLFLNIRLVLTLLRRRADLLVANDLDTLPANYLVSRIKKTVLVYDSHEYFTGSPELMNRPFVRGIWKGLEKFIVPRIKYMMTVNQSIADLYHSEYGIEVVAVRNFSREWNGVVASRSELGISEDDLLCVLQGTGLNTGRGGGELINALKECQGVHLLIIGRGDQIGAIRNSVLENGLIDSVTMLPVMPWDDMMSYTSMADVGLSLDRGDSLNYNFSLPNKLFDYMNAGLALIVTNLKEVAAVVNESGSGIIIAQPDESEIRSALKQFRDNRVLLNQCKAGSSVASGRYRWEKEKEKLIDLYSRAGLNFNQ